MISEVLELRGELMRLKAERAAEFAPSTELMPRAPPPGVDYANRTTLLEHVLPALLTSR